MISEIVQLRFAGVPEHFNAPFHIAKADGLYAREGVNIEWTDFPSGTGSMCRALQENAVDVAIILTDGAVSNLLQEAGGNSRFSVVGSYVRSPLTWGVHTADLKTSSVSEMGRRIFGISRKGSGSHLMAYLFAKRNGWDLKTLQFEVVDSLDGARQAFKDGRIDLFLWETFTCKWLCDQGEWSKIDEITTPWPCFVVAATKEAIHEKGVAIRKALEITRRTCTVRFFPFQQKLHLFCSQAVETHRENWVGYFADKYKMQEADSRRWLSDVNWACEPCVDTDMIASCAIILKEASILTGDICVQQIVANLCGDNDADHLHAMYWYRKKQIVADVEEVLKSHPNNEGLTIEEEATLTTYHYWGDSAIEKGVAAFSLPKNLPCRILDAGSGLGGTSRYMLRTCYPLAQIINVEIQSELSELSKRLSERAGLTDKTLTLCENLCTITPDHIGGLVDAMCSFNVFLHIPDKKLLFSNMRKLMKTGARLHVEDYYRRAELSKREDAILRRTVACRNLQTRQEYIATLENAGFKEISFEDCTESFRTFVAQRSQGFMSKYPMIEKKHGTTIAMAFKEFYDGVAEVFTGQAIGGVRYTAVAV